MSASPLPLLLVKAVRRGDTRTIDLFAEPEARPVAAPTPPRPAVSTPAATGPATPIKQLPVKVITRKDGHTQTYHVAPEDESGSFGPVFRQFRHDGQGAVAHLTKIKTGKAVAALHHPEVGDIDLVWGQEGTAAKGYEDGYGLAKIAVKHPNILNNLQGVLDTLQEDKEKSTDAYKILTSPDHKAIVRMDWDRKAKTWLLTAYSIQEAPGAGTRAGAAKPGEAARASTGSTQSLAPSPDLGNQPPPDRTALLDDKEDLADERVRNPGSAKAKELEARIAAAEGTSTKPVNEYRYALFNRPAGWGGTPKGHVRVEPRPEPGTDHHETARHGIIVYDRPLTVDEMKGFELHPLVDGAERAVLAQEVANDLSKYRDKLVALADQGKVGQIRSSIASRFERLHPENPSVGDFDAFMRQVVDALRKDAPATEGRPDKDQEAVPSFDPAAHIKLAADDVSRLRSSDVDRLFDEAPHSAKSWQALASYLTDSRPDLKAAVTERMSDNPPAEAQPPATEAEAMAAIEQAKRARETPSAANELQAMAQGVLSAVEEMPARLTHGDTGQHGFFLVGDRAYVHNEWAKIPVKRRAEAIPVHSHSADGGYTPDYYDTEPHDPLNGYDVHIWLSGLTKGQNGPQEALIYADGTMDVLRVTAATDPAVFRLGKKRLESLISSDTDERQRAWLELGQHAHELHRDKLRAFCTRYGIEFHEGVRWASKDQAAALRARHPSLLVRNPGRFPVTEAEALEAIERAKRAREGQAGQPTLTAEALANKRDAIETLQLFMDEFPRDDRVPQWRQRQAELRAEVGDTEPEAPRRTEASTSTPAEIDTSRWTAPQQAAHALMQDYQRDFADISLNKRALGAFKRRVRALAKKTPEDDDKAVTMLAIMTTRLDWTWQDKSLEFAPATGGGKVVAKAINRHLGNQMGDLLAPMETATVIIPTYTKEDGTVVRAHPAKVRRRPKVVAVTRQDQALDAAIEHLSTDSRQSGIPKEHQAEDQAMVGKLKAAAQQGPAAKERALKQVIAHLGEDQGDQDLPKAEHAEDRALAAKLKAAVMPKADPPAAKPTPKWAEDPPLTPPVARYPNREDGVEGRVVPRADGRYAAILWDTDADRAVGIKIFPDLEQAKAYARQVAHAPAATGAPADPPATEVPAPADPDPVTPALTPTERDVHGYTQHLTTPAVILAAATLRHQLGIQDQLRAMVALSTGKVPGATDLSAPERATAAWLAASLPLTHRVYSRIPQGNGGWSGVSRDDPITAAAHLDGESVRDALLLELGYGRQFINARPADAFSDLGVQWGALRATDGDQGYFDSTPAAWARRVRHFIDSKAALARAQYLLGSAAWLTPKTPGDKAGVMAEITRLGLATPEQFEQGLERHFSLTAPLKKEVQGFAPSREDLIAGTRGLDDLVLYRLVGSLNQAKVHTLAGEVKALHGQLRQALTGLDPKDATYWTAFRQALDATGWQEVKVNSAFNRKQVFALQAPGGGLVELGLRSFANASPVFAFPGEPRTYLHRGPERLSSISHYLETLGVLRTPTPNEVAAAQPKEKRPAPERAPVAYAPVAQAKRRQSPQEFYGRATPAEVDSGAKTIRTLMRQDLKRGLAAGRLPPGLQVSITGDARSIDLRLTGVPAGMPVLNPAWVVARANGFDPEYGEQRVPRYAPATQQVLDDLEAVFRKYRWDKSDSMTDYFHANYWGGASISYTLEDRYDDLVPKASQATLGDTVTVDGVTYRLTGEPPRWHRADQAPPTPPASRGPAKVVKVTATPPAAASPEARQRQADKLRAAADSLAAGAQATQAAERLTNTARRARMASGALERAAKQEALAVSARHLATALAAGEVTHLAKVNSLAAVETLDSLLQDAMYRRDRERWEYRERERNQGRPAEAADLDYVTWPQGEATVARLQRLGILQQSELRAALGEYLTHRAGAKALDPVQVAELAIAGQKVGVDFFPTPKSLAARMATLAGIKPGMRVLEPSAGNGHLADAARAQGAEVDAVEVSDALRNILGAKGHRLAGRDFNEFETAQPYDAILMNPPFSDRQDAAHIQRAWDLLKPGGTLVALAGEGVFFGQDLKAKTFRAWLDAHEAEVEKLPEGSFLDRTLPQTTGVNARLLVLHKPAAVPVRGDQGAPDEDAQPAEADYPTATDYLAALRAWRERTGNRTAFDERKEARIERLQERASNASAEGERRRAKAQAIGGRFELGQPIILGHHSEAGARRDRERMDQNMRASIEAYDKAGRLTERADAAADNRAISADDEDAVVKLKARIEELEALQARMKAVNAAHARYLKDPASLEQANLSDREKEQIRTYQPAYRSEPHPIAPWQMTNNSANLRRLKERLTDLTAQRDLAAEAQTAGPLTFDGGTVEANGELNRVQIFFDRKPAQAVRDQLKARGFRWAPAHGAWQRPLTAEALATAKEVLLIKAQRLPRVTLVRRAA